MGRNNRIEKSRHNPTSQSGKSFCVCTIVERPNKINGSSALKC